MMGVQAIKPSVKTILSYLEYLSQNLKSHKSVRNYFSAISTLHKAHGLKFKARKAYHVKTMLKAITVTLKEANRRKLPITIQQLKSIVQSTNKLGDIGVVLKVGILFGFYGFLRQSNLAPKSTQDFDISKNTTRSDISFKSPGLVISIKWSKTRQSGGRPHSVPLPSLQCKDLCPVRAYKKLLKVAPTVDPTQPLLSLSPGHFLCIPAFSTHFKHILANLVPDPTLYSLHSLRRGGATAAVNAGASLVSTMQHGDWKSMAVWDYLVSEAPSRSQVANVFKQSI